MNWSVFYGILIPFLGTSFGAACVFFMKKEMGDRLQLSLIHISEPTRRS